MKINPKKKTMKNLKLISLFVALTLNGCHVITPVEMTHTAIGETFVRINIYTQENNKIPETLNMLTKRENYINKITDGWDKELLYTINDNVISLTSYGKDGINGGKDENADITKSYFYKKPNGTLWVGQDLWIVEAEKH